MHSETRMGVGERVEWSVQRRVEIDVEIEAVRVEMMESGRVVIEAVRRNTRRRGG